MRHRIPSRAREGRLVLLASAHLLAGCEEPPPAATTPEPSRPTCAAAAVEVPSRGFMSAASIESAVQAAVTRDFHADACLVSAQAMPDALLVEATHDGRTIRARLAASGGIPTESLSAHVTAHQELRRLLDAGVQSAISTGRGVALAFADDGAICFRDVGRSAECVRTPPALGLDAVCLDSLRESSPGTLVVRSPGDPSAVLAAEWELRFGPSPVLLTRSGRLTPATPLGTPPPPIDRFARVHTATATESTPTPEPAAQPIAEAMPRGSVTVRFETRSVGMAQVLLLSRCEGGVAHCVSILATSDGTTLRMAPSFASDPARMDLIDDASALAPGAVRVRIVETGYHEGAASDVFLVDDGTTLRTHTVALGRETERGDEEVISEGCYRSLSIQGPNRVRLSEARGWSGTRTGGRGWRVATSRTCAPDADLCLDPSVGFAPCP